MQKRTLLDGLTGGSDDRLDLVRVDETGDVRSRDLGSREADKIVSLIIWQYRAQIKPT